MNNRIIKFPKRTGLQHPYIPLYINGDDAGNASRQLDADRRNRESLRKQHQRELEDLKMFGPDETGE